MAWPPSIGRTAIGRIDILRGIFSSPNGPARKHESTGGIRLNKILVALSIAAPAERLLCGDSGAGADFQVGIAGTVRLQALRSYNDAIHDVAQGHQGSRGGRLARREDAFRYCTVDLRGCQS